MNKKKVSKKATEKIIDWRFWLKVFRNGLILGAIEFIALWAVFPNIEWLTIMKPTIIFFLGYYFTELARYYGLSPQSLNKRGMTYVYS